MRRALLSGFMLLLTLASSGISQAATVRPLSLSELATKADKIVHARVVGLDEGFGNKDNAFRTRLQFEILETIKGEASDTFDMVLPGGHAGKFFSWIPGMPRFTLHDEVVLFLEENSDGTHAFMGLSQGVFFIDHRRGLGTLERQLAGTHFVGEKKQPVFSAPTNLRGFLKIVRSYAKGIYR